MLRTTYVVVRSTYYFRDLYIYAEGGFGYDQKEPISPGTNYILKPKSIRTNYTALEKDLSFTHTIQTSQSFE